MVLAYGKFQAYIRDLEEKVKSFNEDSLTTSGSMSDLKRELETAQRGLSQDTILDVDSSLATSLFGAIRNSVSPAIRYTGHDIPASASVANNPKSAISATLKQIASLIRDPQDASYVSLNSMDGDDFQALTSDNGADAAKTSKDTSRVLGAVTALKTNVTHSLRSGVTKTKKDATRPKYVGGIALKKTMPHKVRRQSRKPFVPLVFSKSRISVKRNSLPAPAQDLEIGLPFNARKVVGTSSHLGGPTMEALKGDEAFDIGASDLSSAFPVLTPVNSLDV